MKKPAILLTLVNILLLCNSINAQYFIKTTPPDSVTAVYRYSGGVISGITLFEYFQNTGGTGNVIISATKSKDTSIIVASGKLLKLMFTYDGTVKAASSANEVQIKITSANGTQNFTESIGSFYTPGASIFIPTPPPGHFISLPGTWNTVNVDTCIAITTAQLTSSALVPLSKTVSSLQNYPNPFNSSMIISFNLVSKSFVTLKILDFTGSDIATLVSEELSSGNHLFHWNAETFSGGVYFYNLKSGSFTETKKILLVK